MKISFLLPHLQLYGGIRRIVEISNILFDKGHEIYIFHSDGSGCEWAQVKARVLPFSEFFGFEHDHMIYIFHSHYREAKKVKAKQKYFYCLNLYDKFYLSFPNFVLSSLKNFSHSAGLAYELKRGLTEKEFKILFNCTDSREWLKKHIGRDSDVVLGGVDFNMFHHVEVEKDPQAIKILYLGSPKPWKGSGVVKKSFGFIKREFPQAELESFYGSKQEELAKKYSSADVFVDAQNFAGWNNPVAEAMACKVPVVCGDIGPNKDIAINNETALIVPVNDPKAYAGAVLKLIKDKQLSQKLVENAYNKISEFTWERTANGLINSLRT